MEFKTTFILCKSICHLTTYGKLYVLKGEQLQLREYVQLAVKKIVTLYVVRYFK